MQPSLWSNFFHKMPGDQAMRELKRAEFEWTELASELLTDPATNSPSADMARELRAVCDELGLKSAQFHYPICTLNPSVDTSGDFHPGMLTEFAHPDPARREFDLRCAEEFLALCPICGVEVMVVHPGGLTGWSSEAERVEIGGLNEVAFTRLAETASRNGVIVAVENMGIVGGSQSFGARIEDLVALVDAVGSPHVGICLDTSHANVMQLDIPQTIRQAGDRLVATHISDNLGQHDDHLMPYAGRIDWPPVVEALREIGYARLFNLEIPGENRCPLEIRRLKANYSRGLLCAMLGE